MATRELTTGAEDHRLGGVHVSLNAYERKFLSRLPEDGSAITNPRLRSLLGMGKRQYEDVCVTLIGKGLVVKARGRGGMVRRTEDCDVSFFRYERELYEPFRGVIRDDWATWSVADNQNPDVVAITAAQGRRATGGVWTRPDITAATVRSFDFLPVPYLDVTTFEVKPALKVDVQAVFEALAHRRAATRSYLLVHATAGDFENEHLFKISNVAANHGIGFILAEDPGDSETWEERVTPERVTPDPVRLDDFLATQLPENDRAEIRAALDRALSRPGYAPADAAHVDACTSIDASGG